MYVIKIAAASACPRNPSKLRVASTSSHNVVSLSCARQAANGRRRRACGVVARQPFERDIVAARCCLASSEPTNHVAANSRSSSYHSTGLLVMFRRTYAASREAILSAPADK